jgi:hypothetical protein
MLSGFKSVTNFGNFNLSSEQNTDLHMWIDLVPGTNITCVTVVNTTRQIDCNYSLDTEGSVFRICNSFRQQYLIFQLIAALSSLIHISWSGTKGRRLAFRCTHKWGWKHQILQLWLRCKFHVTATIRTDEHHQSYTALLSRVDPKNPISKDQFFRLDN